MLADSVGRQDACSTHRLVTERVRPNGGQDACATAIARGSLDKN